MSSSSHFVVDLVVDILKTSIRPSLTIAEPCIVAECIEFGVRRENQRHIGAERGILSVDNSSHHRVARFGGGVVAIWVTNGGWEYAPLVMTFLVLCQYICELDLRFRQCPLRLRWPGTDS